MKKDISYAQPINSIKNGKIHSQILYLDLSVQCDCSDMELLDSFAEHFQTQFNFKNSIFVDKNLNLDLFLPLEESGFFSIVVVEKLETLVNDLLLSIRNYINEKTNIILTNMSLNLSDF